MVKEWYLIVLYVFLRGFIHAQSLPFVSYLRDSLLAAKRSIEGYWYSNKGEYICRNKLYRILSKVI